MVFIIITSLLAIYVNNGVAKQRVTIIKKMSKVLNKNLKGCHILPESGVYIIQHIFPGEKYHESIVRYDDMSIY
ncbi:hypothetical protein RhiirA1_29242 [Rhizophagus irregularis]|uniref:Uncharacterized protein n=1 Tax=Rhizophagus irregularis TaxID=588596 RepID=A0A2N0SAC1_9GLOM|nr:hypothetical protein RhiirA1_107471 [Rhizophagus irregularis]PKC72500.1 hypothetical protein RhiirA1_29242 [Rhizophagus irregularis]